MYSLSRWRFLCKTSQISSGIFDDVGVSSGLTGSIDIEHRQDLCRGETAGQEGTFELLAGVVQQLVHVIAVGAQPGGDFIERHFIKGVSDERGALPGREIRFDETRQDPPCL